MRVPKSLRPVARSYATYRESLVDAKDLTDASNMMDSNSTIKEITSDLNHRLAERVRELRTAQGLSLETLAATQRREPFDDLAHRAW